MITINIDKAKQIGHSIRRQSRDAEFAPLDEKIAKQIPGTDIQAVEMERQKIRNKYADIQLKIDAAKNVDEIKSALK